ncbi:uncharacterized protein BYT42DRAFT_489833 [Radiomyces spectabilis]|uniref:uncharacterized protein n=1 Tax=Radiomyces spectabilis TaxID=64574 RepID=UPI00221EB0AC|nr:uncharacterized protein BYT42DRAFT_489833 [Radiomyces spectabilis]KAI8391693.1 hypothetical protein BYT42DRAFT_489833 [Radiomyces spectabilis]
MQKPSRNGLNRLYTLSEFRSLCSPHNAAHLTDADLYLLLKYLHAQWGVAVADNVKGYGSYYTVVKFPDQAGHPTAQVTIDDNDKAMISLKTNCWALQSQVKELQSKIDELTDSLKKEYAQRHIPQALYLLKRKKNLLQLLERRMQILDTMESMLFRIEISQDDLQVVEAFNVGADTLRRILDQEDLSTASVSESMARVQDTLQEQQQVEDALVSGGESASYAYQPELKNDDALLDELNQLGESTETSSSAETLPLPIDTGSELARLNELFASLKTINTTLAQQHPTPSKRVAELA